MDIVLFGIQGSGKGTLGKGLASKYQLEIFETGAELRKLSQQDSDLAKKVKAIMQAGHLVPNEVVMEIIENFMKQLPAGKSVLFDGIPRKQEQADSFNALMSKLGRNFTGILLEVSEEIAIRRLSSRRMCENCKTIFPATYTQETCEKCGGKLITRSDDNPESIKTRIEVFFKETVPVIEEYKKQGKMLTLDGSLNMEQVEQNAFQLLEGKL